MASLLFNKTDIADINTKVDIPVEISYANQCFELRGSFNIIWEFDFFARLSLKEFNFPYLVLKIEKSEPAFGSIDNFVKSALASYLRKKVQVVEIDFPNIRIDIQALPKSDILLEQADIQDVFFGEDGVRVEFELNKKTTWAIPKV